MADYRTMFEPKEHISAWELPKDRDVVLTISKVEAGVLTNGTTKTKKPIVFFEGKDRGMAFNRTNAKVVAGMYGTDVSQWVGKRIAIYPTTTMFGKETVDCIRVRPTIPQPKQPKQADEVPS